MNQVRCSRYCSLTLKILILISHLERYHVKTEPAESYFYLSVIRKKKKSENLLFKPVVSVVSKIHGRRRTIG